MRHLILRSLEEHQAVERELDRLLLSLAAGAFDRDNLESALGSALAHYEREERELFSEARNSGFERIVAKLEAQHGEAREIGGEALQCEAPGEDLRLARRFHAIAQHNIIEEERDVFPLLEADPT